MTGNRAYQEPGKPLTRARSQWVSDGEMEISGVREYVWRRRVGDGNLLVIVGEEPAGWHLSISFADHRGRNSRYPRWDEIADARYLHVPDYITMAMILPPPDEYVALHDTTFHLHQIADDG
jgi:hypothetical protein